MEQSCRRIQRHGETEERTGAKEPLDNALPMRPGEHGLFGVNLFSGVGIDQPEAGSALV
jgi:hypothetical protein